MVRVSILLRIRIILSPAAGTKSKQHLQVFASTNRDVLDLDRPILAKAKEAAIYIWAHE
jgi:hypothetical protein